MRQRSNLFANVENKYKFAKKQEIMEMSLNATGKLLDAVEQLDDKTTLAIMISGAKLGVAGDGILTREEQDLVDEIFGRLGFKMDLVYALVKAPLEDSDYKIIELAMELGNYVAMSLLHYILCFAYVDGKFEDDVAERLDGIYGTNLLADFMQSGQNEVPAPKVRLTGIEAEIVCWFREKNEMYALEDIKKHFSDCPPSEVQRALGRLVEKGIIYGGANFIGNMYGLCNADAAWTYEIDNDSVQFEKERAKKLEEEQRRKAEEAQRRKEEIARRTQEENEKRKEQERIRQAEIEEYRKIQEDRRKAQEDRQKEEERKRKDEEEAAERARKDEIYEKAMACMESDTLEKYREAARLFDTIPEWRDTWYRRSKVQKKLTQLEAEFAAEKEKKKKAALIVGLVVAAVLAAIFFLPAMIS